MSKTNHIKHNDKHNSTHTTIKHNTKQRKHTNTHYTQQNIYKSNQTITSQQYTITITNSANTTHQANQKTNKQLTIQIIKHIYTTNTNRNNNTTIYPHNNNANIKHIQSNHT